MDQIPQLLLTIPQAATALSCRRSKVYTLIKKHGLPTVLIGGTMRIYLMSLQRWIEQQEHDQNPPE